MRRMETAGGGLRMWGGLALGAGILLLPSACASGGSTEGAGNAPSSEASASASAAPPPSLIKVKELADNKNGVPVFSDTKGSALKNGEPARIPYGTAVEVDCVAPNLSGMTSINGMYHVVGGTWNGNFVPANTMDNGAGLGPNPVDLDPRVASCPPGTPGTTG
jgi:hypothetical protein